ncbi:uncharacterized protein LOC107865735 isoform X1 [Capsicum annuum]|uniref:uncharacterized protein LOC107865735 isoform X1 n=1 Tax=Capsicum annuum TaxID=4072 RepID=UPI001FB0F96C|nr:uncharacterized protein LOC107865735 isoform X1 [Capsicum annuum]
MASSSSDSSTLVPMAVDVSAIYFCNIKNLVPTVLDYTNYTLWRELFLPIFKGYGVYGFIDGSYPCPEPAIREENGDSVAFQQWIQVDSIILSWIQATISQQILQEIILIKSNRGLTCRDAWLKIEQLIHNQNVQKYYKHNDQLDVTGKKLLRVRNRICKHSEKKKNSTPFIRFGPLYGPGDDEIQEKKIQAAKDEVWLNILRSSPANDEEVTKGLYVSAIRSIEKEARESYIANDNISFLQLTGTEFRMMMIKDGCFFIHLALFMLVEGHNHRHVHNKLLQELLHNKKQQCVASMFHVGNQIPLVVLKSLMKQNYFRELIAICGSLKTPKSDLVKMALYEFVLLPAIVEIETEKRSNCSPHVLQFLFSGTKHKAANQMQHQPCDLLHGFHQLLLGLENNDKIEDEQGVDDSDLVETDLEAGRHGTDSSTPILRRTGDLTTGRSASELKQSGVKFKVFEGIGIKGISFKKRYYPFDPYLALPQFLVDAHSKVLIQSLKDYETAQNFDDNEREVTSYLRFMHELIRTSEDAKVLQLNGIIKGSWKHTEKVPRMLKEVAGEEEVTCPKLRLAKFKLNYFDRPPWVNLMSQYFTLIFALTVIQTFYAVLAYHRPNS